jgi:hypothetical protein
MLKYINLFGGCAIIYMNIYIIYIYTLYIIVYKVMNNFNRTHIHYLLVQLYCNDMKHLFNYNKHMHNIFNYIYLLCFSYLLRCYSFIRENFVSLTQNDMPLRGYYQWL